MDTMPDMTQLMDRQKLVGWIVRDQIIRQGLSFSEAARRWGISLATLNRLMNTGVVRERFYAIAEKNLGLPDRLLTHVADGDIAAVRDRTGINEDLKVFILRELGDTTRSAPRARRKRA